jgi:hypothetical protein
MESRPVTPGSSTSKTTCSIRAGCQWVESPLQTRYRTMGRPAICRWPETFPPKLMASTISTSCRRRRLEEAARPLSSKSVSKRSQPVTSTNKITPSTVALPNHSSPSSTTRGTFPPPQAPTTSSLILLRPPKMERACRADKLNKSIRWVAL